jgi:predicted Zn finger-like uncharacterized protein
MSMITRCPECTTMFKVVPDQLRVSDGWVRCGQCGQVFDGNANLQPDVPDQPDPAAPERTQPVTADGWEDWGTDVPPAPVPDAPDVAAPFFDEEVAEPEAVDIELPTTAQAAHERIEPMADEAWSAGLTARLTTPAVQVQALQEDSTASSWGHASADVSFVRAARREAFWSQRWLRWTMVGACLLLALLLALQWTVHERDWLAATQPVTRPWLQGLCEPLGCRIEALKAPDAIAIESSSFSPVRGDLYRLQVVVKNTARTEVARPALELTLTDTRDVPLLRRVLLPADFSPDLRPMAASGEWSGSLVLRVANSGARVAGYRVLAFYP